MTSYRALWIPYRSKLNFQIYEDILHVSPQWRKGSARHDCIMLQGRRQDDLWFAQVYEMFVLHLRGGIHTIALVNMFRGQKRHSLSDYIQLDDVGKFEFIHLSSIIRACHILTPTFTQGSRHTVQDLVDMDSLLRLQSIR